MLHFPTMNNKINRLQERSLRIVYSDQNSTFEELLERDKIFSIHHKNIQNLPIEVYKFVNGLYPEIMENVFHLKENSRYSQRFLSIQTWRYKNEHLASQSYTIKRSNYIFVTFTMNGRVYIKQNQNSRSVVIPNMNVLHDMQTNFYNLTKEGKENRDKSGHQNASVLSSYQVSSGLLYCICENVRGLSAPSSTFSAYWLYGEALGRYCVLLTLSRCSNFFFISIQCFGYMETG